MGSNSANECGDHFDLLPFIAILMCVLGCLLLVTLSMAAVCVGVGAGEGWTPVANPQTPITRPGAGREGIPGSDPVANKIPILIEWDGTTAIIHRDPERISVTWSKPSGILVPGGMLGSTEEQWIQSRETLDSDKEFHKALTELVALRDTHYALFAVRPTGFKNFQVFANEFRARKMNVGFEPIHQARAVRLLFKGTDHAPKTDANPVP
jgi:hypothetical protein